MKCIAIMSFCCIFLFIVEMDCFRGLIAIKNEFIFEGLNLVFRLIPGHLLITKMEFISNTKEQYFKRIISYKSFENKIYATLPIWTTITFRKKASFKIVIVVHKGELENFNFPKNATFIIVNVIHNGELDNFNSQKSVFHNAEKM